MDLKYSPPKDFNRFFHLKGNSCIKYLVEKVVVSSFRVDKIISISTIQLSCRHADSYCVKRVSDNF